MSDQSTKRRAIAAAAGLVGVRALRARRRRRLQATATMLHDTVSVPDPPADLVVPEVTSDAAHAPGHRHLGPPPEVHASRRALPWPRRADKLGHPGRFSG